MVWYDDFSTHQKQPGGVLKSSTLKIQQKNYVASLFEFFNLLRATAGGISKRLSFYNGSGGFPKVNKISNLRYKLQ